MVNLFIVRQQSKKVTHEIETM